jgi:hypothetical protein
LNNTKLAGIAVFIASIDQFGLRACLQCSEETSLDVLGNRAAFNELKARGSILTNNKRTISMIITGIPYPSQQQIHQGIYTRLIQGGKEGKFPENGFVILAKQKLFQIRIYSISGIQ